MFVSLKYKALFLSSFLVLGLSSFFSIMGERQLESLYQSQRSENLRRHKTEIQGIILQSDIHLQQFTDFLSTLNHSDKIGANAQVIFNNNWEYLRTNLALELAILYDRGARKINQWGDKDKLKNIDQIIQKSILETATDGIPSSILHCAKYCLQILITPIISADNEHQILLLARPITNLLISFSTLSHADIGILTVNKNNKNNSKSIDNWNYQITAITHFNKNMPLLQKASEQLSFNELLASNRSITLQDSSFQISIIPTQVQSNNSFFIIIEDVTSERNQISSATRSYIGSTISAIIVFSILIIAMLWHPIIRLRQQAELMPLLSQGKFEFVRSILAKKNRNRWLKDEIDIIDNSEMEVSLQLENMQSQIETHNEELQQLVFFDTLTGLANRRALLDETQKCLSKKNAEFALLFLDLDNFKRINDSLGHQAGDELLKIVGKRLNSCVRSSDMVARLGGDEFCILVRKLRNKNDGCIVATNVLNILKNPVRLQTTEVIISASIGIVISPEDGETTEDLLQNADLAMYKAKALGRNKYQIFNHAMTKNAIEQMALENELRQALIKHEFILHYQPQIDLKNNYICSVEALVRWQHPTRGLLAPGHFISALEETGLIVPLGEWILIEACEALKRWIDAGMQPIRMSVNLSSRQFQDPKLYDIIEETLAITQVSADLLELEVTESMVMHDIENNNRVLQELQKLGVSIAIDDFGTGYSSFSYLKALPLDTLKIDRSFVMDIPHDETDMEITSAIIAVAHKLKLIVVAEGIETVEQQKFLLNEGCDLGQGYLFSRPVNEKDLIYLLENPNDVLIN